MSNGDSKNDPNDISPREMNDWLAQEIKDLTKAFELRVKEATEFVTAYALGEMSSKEATERCYRYQQRWGEALPGTNASSTVSDEKLLEAIDEARSPDFARRLVRGNFDAVFKKGRQEPDTSR